MPIINHRGKVVTNITPDKIFASPVSLQERATDLDYPERDDVNRGLNELFDITDSATRHQLMNMNEAGHNSVLTSLTAKLYDHIVKKTHDIDYGEIPSTKGDITKLENYDDLIDAMAIIKDILKEYKQATGPIDTLTMALANVKSRKDLFMRGYSTNCDLIIAMYNNTALSIVAGLSYLIAACIEFIKAPKDDAFTISLDKVAYAKSKDHILYDSLEKFNRACASGQFDEAMNIVIGNKVRKFTGVAIGVLAASAIGIFVILNIIPILREMVYVLFSTRTSIADFCDIQADLIQMNAYNLEHNSTIDATEKAEIIEKQLAIADDFRDISNKVQIDRKRTDVEASSKIQASEKKYKLDDEGNDDYVEVDDGTPSSALF